MLSFRKVINCKVTPQLLYIVLVMDQRSNQQMSPNLPWLFDKSKYLFVCYDCLEVIVTIIDVFAYVWSRYAHH